MDVNNPKKIALWCAKLDGFFCLLRKKIICPESGLDIDTIRAKYGVTVCGF